MHGMINRAIERFVRDTYGRDSWRIVVRRLGLEFNEFEAMMTYPGELTGQVLEAVAETLNKEMPEVLEDIGTYLVSHPNVEAIRRLLRFGGVDFIDFLHSLDDLPARTRLAVNNLYLPELELREHRMGFFSLTVCSGASGLPGFGHVVMGLLRSMADDYGALVMLDYKGVRDQSEILEIHLLDMAHAEGRSFQLGLRAVP